MPDIYSLLVSLHHLYIHHYRQPLTLLNTSRCSFVKSHSCSIKVCTCFNITVRSPLDDMVKINKKSFPRLSKSFPRLKKSFPRHTKSFPRLRKSFPRLKKSFPRLKKSFPRLNKSFARLNKSFPRHSKLSPRLSYVVPTT